MRKLFTTAVAVAMMGLGVSSAHASATPMQAVYDAAVGISDTNNPTGVKYDASAVDGGAQLAGLARAYQFGNQTTNVKSAINSLAGSITSSGANGPVNYLFTGNQAYGLVQAGLQAPGAGANVAPGLAAVGQYYTAGYQSSGGFQSQYGPGATSIQQYADYVGSTSGARDVDTYVNQSAADNALVMDVSFHVLATHQLGAGFSTQNAAFVSTLKYDLSNFDTTIGSVGAGDFSPTEVLGASLWALRTSGVSASFTLSAANGTLPNATWAGQTLTQLAESLRDKLVADVATTAYSEEVGYGILALQQFIGLGVNPITQADINLLSSKFAFGVNNASLSTPYATPQIVGDGVTYSGLTPVSNSAAAAAMLSLPEPTCLSLIGLAGMALLTRRRRI